MFKRKEGLKSKDIKIILNKGKNYSARFFRLLYSPSENLGVAVVIAKKTLKRRVDRNRLKRRILHILREIIQKEQTGNFLFFVKHDAIHLSSEELRSELRELVSKV